MPRVESYKQGVPSWIDLSTTDHPGAKKFYSDVFGWEYQDNPMGEGMVYSMAQLNGAAVCAMYQQQQGEVDMGLPSHWNVYFTVADIESTAAKVGELGGTVLAGPMDIFEAGRMIVALDPAGAQIQFWQPLQHIGAEVRDEHGALTWAEVMTTDLPSAGEFYSSLLGTTLDTESMPTPDGEPYHMLTIDGIPQCGLMKLTPELLAQNVPPHWEIYFRVDDANVTSEVATANGAELLWGPTEIVMVGTIAVFKDPQGAVFGIQEAAAE